MTVWGLICDMTLWEVAHRFRLLKREIKREREGERERERERERES